MRKTLVMLAACWVMAGAAAAQMEYPNSVAKRVGIYGNLGYAQYVMGDENRWIDDLNAAYAPSSALGHIASGVLFNLGAEYGLTDNFLVGLEVEGLSAATRGELQPGLSANFSFPATAFGGFVKAALPMGDYFLMNVGAGIYSLSVDSGRETYSSPGYLDIVDTYKGSTVEFKFSVGGDFFITPNFVVGADAGYRLAKVGELRNPALAGEPKWLNPDGSNYTLDYSGPFAQAGIRWFFSGFGQ